MNYRFIQIHTDERSLAADATHPLDHYMDVLIVAARRVEHPCIEDSLLQQVIQNLSHRNVTEDELELRIGRTVRPLETVHQASQVRVLKHPLPVFELAFDFRQIQNGFNKFILR